MKIVNPYYFDPIEMSGDRVYTVVIESTVHYRKILEELCGQAEGYEGNFVISENNEPVDFMKSCAVITDLYHINLNERPIINALNTDIVKQYVGSELAENTIQTLNSFGSCVCQNSQFTIAFDTSLQLLNAVKCVGFQIDDQRMSLLEKLLEYCYLSIDLLKKKMVIINGLKEAVSTEEYFQFIESVFDRKIPLLLLEHNVHPEMDDRKNTIIIDKDLCRIS